MRKVVSLLTVASVLSAAPLVAQDVDPAGKYEFTTMVEGQTVGGTMEITGTAGSWTGLILAEGQPEIPVSSVEVNGNMITMYASIPEAGELLIEIEMNGEEFVGSWSLGFDGGELQGRKIGT